MPCEIAPKMFVNPEILRRIEPAGVMNRVRGVQNSVMNSMLQANRLNEGDEPSDFSMTLRPLGVA